MSFILNKSIGKRLTPTFAQLTQWESIASAKKVKKEDHRNVFLNLAVPIMQASEPGDVEKVKLTEKIETTLWDRWEVDAHKLSLGEVISKVSEKYEGLEVRDVLRGNAPIYFHAIMNAPGKEKEKERTLKTDLAELLEANLDEGGDSYVDLTITCVLKDDPADKILEGVPPLRVNLAPKAPEKKAEKK